MSSPSLPRSARAHLSPVAHNKGFYLELPLKWSGRWDLKLHRGGKDGPDIAHVTKSRFKNDLRLELPHTGFGTEFIRPNPLEREFLVIRFSQEALH